MMWSIRLAVLFITFGVLGTSELRAEPLYGAQFFSNTLRTRDLRTINTTTGVATTVGSMGFSGVAGLAFDSNTNTLYGSDTVTDQLIIINTTTGAGTVVGPFLIDNVLGLAFDSNTNTLYGTVLGINSLITINTTTGAGTVVGPLLGSGGFTAGLAFDPNTNTLYGSDRVSHLILRINTSTGATTSVGPSGFGNVRGLAFDPNTNTLYGSDCERQSKSGAPGRAKRQLKRAAHICAASHFRDNSALLAGGRRPPAISGSSVTENGEARRSVLQYGSLGNCPSASTHWRDQ